ncbi:DUF1508 domain-containing protein [Halobacteria archaeon AArc-m2/3/4]|uniref:DUF1508 domain-containing protein n=1 Tax=Natronoglomus mannanivorans TaxID=2979990 RepID=A0ABT2Q9X0_9EURY|nr:DUF1508 domain-containing protein [Halobacteria archaeon AArc-m2/3/4]
MSGNTGFRTELFRLYEHYVGDPDSSKDVYGYWLFIVGYIAGAAGVLLYLIGYATVGDEHFVIRVSAVVAASGLVFGLLGFVLMLPVRRRGIQASIVGTLVALVGVGSFGVVYPSHWRGYGEDLGPEVMGVFTAGIAVIAGVAALIPVVTGQRGMFVEEEGVTEEPPVMTGDALEGAQFAVFRDEAGDWKWHILHLEALAGSEESATTRPQTEEDIERVKSQIGSAGLMELTTSAFRLYERRDGQWQWTLMREDGSVVADCGNVFGDRDGAEQSVSFLKDRGPEADVIDIEGAAFTYTNERDDWFWQLLDEDRNSLATSEVAAPTQADAEDAAVDFAERFGEARLLALEDVGVELRERESGEDWYWRFVDDTDEEIAASTVDFDSRRDTEDAVEALLPELETASVTVAGEPTYELYTSGESWQWRLVDDTERVIARNPEDLSARSDATNATDEFGAHVQDADIVEIEDAAYETYPVGEEWHWRLVTEDRDVVAASTDPHEDSEAAAEAISRVREQASQADLIEFENAAFQVYEADTGEWRWRLIDEDGNVLADSGEEHTSRGDAAEAMMTLKEQAPEAELLEIDTAAFELFVDDEDRWGWRLIDEAGKLVAEDPSTHPTRGAARQAMNRLLDHLETDVRTMENAIFQTYVEEDWHWRFVLPDGETIAVSETTHPTRDELIESLPQVRDAAQTARDYTIGDVAVQIRESGSGSGSRNGNGNGSGSESASGTWDWRLLDRDRNEIAESAFSYEDRETVIGAVNSLKNAVSDAPIFTIESAIIRLTGDDQWQWELVDRDRNVLASAAGAQSTTDEAIEAVERVRKLAPAAGRVDFDVASFELFADDDEQEQWRWRLIDENGRTVAEGVEPHASSDAARDALEPVRGLIGDASILEIDGVSFELHTAEDGWVWRLVDEHGERMAESTRAYDSRTDAREAMNAVKNHAPEGWITFTE